MMEILKFNTQICTTIEQSKRLLELGLKKETADCIITQKVDGTFDVFNTNCGLLEVEIIKDASKLFVSFSAWSLHRLIEMLPFYIALAKGDNRYISILKDSVHYVTFDDDENREITFNNEIGGANIYDNIIDCIEWLIKERHFNKEYLNETNK